MHVSALLPYPPTSPPLPPSAPAGGHAGRSENAAAAPLAEEAAGCADTPMSASVAGMGYCWRGSAQLGLGDMYSAVASLAMVEGSAQVRVGRSIWTEAGLEGCRQGPVEERVTGDWSEGNHRK